MGFQAIPGSYIARSLLCGTDNIVFDEARNQYLNLNSPQVLVSIFDRQVNERIFEPVEILLNYGTAYLLPAVYILVSYIEYVGRLRSGRAERENSGGIFKDQFKEMFPGFTKKERNVIYSDLRCGFAHVAMTRNGILVQYEEPPNARPIIRDNERGLFLIHTRSLFTMLREYHNQYINTLKQCINKGSNRPMLDNFARVYSVLINARAN